MKNIKNIFIIFSLCACFAGVARGDDVFVAARTVAERTDCTATKNRIDELTGIADLREELATELADLQVLYRRDCNKRSASRGALTAARLRNNRQLTQNSTAECVYDENGCCVGETLTEVADYGMLCCPPTGDMCFVPVTVATNETTTSADIVTEPQTVEAPTQEVVAETVSEPEPVVPEKSEEEIAAERAELRASGVCPDNGKPNRFGCCEGEKFSDLGNLVFACCPETGDCFEPIKLRMNEQK